MTEEQLKQAILQAERDRAAVERFATRQSMYVTMRALLGDVFSSGQEPTKTRESQKTQSSQYDSTSKIVDAIIDEIGNGVYVFALKKTVGVDNTTLSISFPTNAGGMTVTSQIEQGIDTPLAWAAQAYPQLSVVTRNGSTWFANSATLAADVPGTSSKWVVHQLIPTPKIVNFKLAGGPPVLGDQVRLVIGANTYTYTATANDTTLNDLASGVAKLAVSDPLFTVTNKTAAVKDYATSIANIVWQTALNAIGILVWQPQPYPINSVVLYNSQIWTNTLVTLATDVPGVSVKWVLTSYGAAGGDLTGSYPNPSLASITTATTKGSAAKVPVVTIDAKGRVTSLTDVDISGGGGGAPSGPAGGDLAGTYPNPTLAVVSTAATKGTASKSVTATIDAKGRVTSLSDQDIQIAESQVTNLTTDLDAKIPKSLATAADQGLYSTAASTWSVFSLTSMWRTFLSTVKAAWNETTGVFSTWGLQINTAPTTTPTSAPGLLVWDDTNGTIEFQLKGGNVSMHIGETQVVRIKNDSGGALAAGDVVYISGSNGVNLLAQLADATLEATSGETIGIVAEPIAANNHGFVVTFGMVSNINTDHLVEGAPVWLATTPGDTTATRPNAPANGVLLGFCLRKHATVGSIFVRVDNGWELDELHNVLISSVASGDVLVRNAGNTLWQNKAQSTLSVNYATTAGGAPPTGAAGGDLAGTYPNPTLASITTAATKGTASKSATVTIDARGRVTSITDQDIAITKTQAGLGSVDNVQQLPMSYLDIDGALLANSDTKVPSQKAVKTYVDTAVTGLLDFKGSTDCSGNPNYPAASKGDAYIVSVAGKIGGASGVSVDVGDVYLAIADNAGGTYSAVGTSWSVLEHNLVGALLSANNLSDLANTATARTNLGLGNVDNTADASKNVLYATTAGGAPPTGSAGGDLTGTYPNPTLAAVVTAATQGAADKSLTVTVDAKGRVTSLASQSIAITKSQAGLANVDNTADASKSVLYATTAGGAPPTGSAGGDLTGTYPNPTLAAVTTATTLGSATKSLTITVDAKGRITSMTENTVTATDSTKLPLAGGTMTGDLLTAAGVKLGLGTSSPQYAIHAQATGETSLYAGTGFTPALSSGTDPNLLFGYGGAGFRFGGAGTGLSYNQAQIDLTNNQTIRFYTGAGTVAPTERMQITNTGQLQVLGSGGPSITSANTLIVRAATYPYLHFVNNTSGGAASNGFLVGIESNYALLAVKENWDLRFWTNNTDRMRIQSDGKVAIGSFTPTAMLHLQAGTSTAGTAPLKFTGGTPLSTPEAGALEFTTDDLLFTITTGTARKRLAICDASLTSGRIPFSTTNGRLTDSANLTYSDASALATLSLSQNAQTGLQITNANTGLVAVAGIRCTGTSANVTFGAGSSAGDYVGGGFIRVDSAAPITFWTNNLRRVTITSTDGYMAINRNSATARLHIAAGTASATTAPLKFDSGTLMSTPEAGAVEFLTDDLLFTITTGTARKRIALCDAALTSGRVTFATTNGRLSDSANLTFTSPDLFLSAASGTRSLYFGPSTSYNSLTSLNDGSMDLYFGTTATNRGYRFSWQVDRNVVLYSGATAIWNTGTATSDRRLKDNIRPTSVSGIETVKQLQVVDFNWKADSDLDDGGKTHTGLIAQDVANLVPDAVVDTNGTLLLHKEELVPTLLKALQEAIARIEVLEKALAQKV